MDIIKNAKTVVVKVGTSTLTHQNFRMNLYRIEALTRTLSDLKNTGKNIVLVTSGAIGAGIAKTGMDHRPEKIEDKQALIAMLLEEYTDISTQQKLKMLDQYLSEELPKLLELQDMAKK